MPTSVGSASSPFVWLRRPVPLSAPRRRRHVLVLGLLLLVGGVRGTYWSAAMPVWSPIDEVAHMGYVESLAQGDGIPVIGQDLIADDLLVVAKSSPTSEFRAKPYLPSNQDPNWGGVREQYEATAGPTYYALMAVPYWIGHPFGTAGSAFAVRVASVLVGLAALVLVWALARRLFPDRPPVWLAAPALLVLVNSFAFGAVSNDPLVIVLSLAAVLALLRALDDRPAPGWVAGAGVLFGLGMVTKATILVLAPVFVAVVVTWLLARRPGAAAVARTAAVYLAGAVLPVVPWLAWNLVTYGATSGVAEVNVALPPESASFSFGRLGSDLGASQWGLWANQLLAHRATVTFWLVLLAGSAVLAIVVAHRRDRPDEVFAVALGALCLPLGFVMLELINFTLMKGTGAPVGRHLLAVVPFAAIAIAGSLAIVLTRRWLPAAVAAIATIALVLEANATMDLFRRTYERTVLADDLVPVTDQGWSDRQVAGGQILVAPTCPVAALWIGFAEGPPDELVVRTADQEWTVPAEPASSALPSFRDPVVDTTWFRLPAEIDQPFTISVPPTTSFDIADDDRSPELALDGIAGDPVGRLYCRGDDARAVAFARDLPPGHPNLPRGLLVGFAWLQAAIAAAVTVAAVVVGARSRGPAGTAPTRDPGSISTDRHESGKLRT